MQDKVLGNCRHSDWRIRGAQVEDEMEEDLKQCLTSFFGEDPKELLPEIRSYVYFILLILFKFI